jgi:uncharacterized protein (TIGR03032 family)
MIGCDPRDELSVHEAEFDEPTGIRASGGGIRVATRVAIHVLENVLRSDQVHDGRYSHCFVARRSHFIGAMAPHDLAIAGDGRTFFVSSRYSCVATLSPIHSFQLVWKPDFVTEVVAEDRCHLNGLVLDDGEPAYATAFGESNSIDGWREGVDGTGVVLGIRSGEVVCRGLTMPHSPRLHEGRLWLLNSGSGELGVSPLAASATTSFEPIASLPGYTRGLTFHGDLAFVGVSRPRDDSFAGLALHDRLTNDGHPARTGVAIVDIRSGRCVEWLWLEGEAREVYDVAVLPGVRCPAALPSQSQQALGLVTMERSPEHDPTQFQAPAL